MILKEFMIGRYGPLSGSSLKKISAFTLFFGPNEEGKTLTIDALLRMMMGKGVKIYRDIKRVDENPEGYLIIEDNNRKNIKLPEAGTFEDLFGISPTEFANIFVIRDSDSSISGEDNFYRHITNRLTGLRTGEIEELKRKVCEIGGITPGGDFLNTAPLKLKDKIKKGRSLYENIEQLLVEVQEEGFSSFEEELADLKEQRNAAVKKINLYQAAQNRELFEKGKEALKKLGSAMAEKKKLKNFSQGDYETWRQVESNLEHHRTDLEKLEKEIAAQKKGLHSARTSFSESKRTFETANHEKNTAAELIEPGLAEYEREKLALQRQAFSANSAFYKITAAASVSILFLSLLAIIVQPAWWLFPVPVISFALVLLLGNQKYTYLKKKGRLTAIKTKVCSEAEKIGLPADNVQAVQSGLRKLRDDHFIKENQLKDAEKLLEWQQKEEERLLSERLEKLARIKSAEEEINILRGKSGLQTLGHYREVINRKDWLKREIEKQQSILGSHFEQPGSLTSEEARIASWQEQVSKLQEYSAAANELKFDQDQYVNLNMKKDKLELKIKALAEKMYDRSQQLRDIEKEANELLYDEEESSLRCQTTLDLEALHKKTENWLQAREDNKNCAEIAVDILGTVGLEEEEKVTALFGTDNPVSDYFSQITGGLYRKVVFESSQNTIRVVRADGAELDAYQLSGGAYDQLYFSIRLALGEKLLAGRKGFFILDDPFIKADPVRLKLLLEMLFAINAQGWQILYFSAKGEIEAAFREKINSEDIKKVKIT